MKTIYTTTVTAAGDGRNGRITSDDGVLDMTLSTPKQGAKHTNPEQLFAGGYAACFLSALRMIGTMQEKNVDDASIEATIGMVETDGGYSLTVELSATLPHLSQSDADELTQTAYQVCPYSNATRGNVETTVTAHGG